MRDTERMERVLQGVREADLDVLVCALPTNVLLLTGYWPVVGTSVALVARDGPTLLLVPEDERALAEGGWADAVYTFKPSSLDDLRDAVDALRGALGKAAGQFGIGGGKIGYEGGSAYEPSSYAALHHYGESLQQLFEDAFPAGTLLSATALLGWLRRVKTPRELEHLRAACRVARLAFEHGAAALRPGQTEAEVAQRFQGILSIQGLRLPGVARAGGFVFCMSGVHSAGAGAAYARTRARQLEPDDLVLVHCNSYVDGYWTDITRTYCLGQAGARQEKMYAAVQAARAAALAVIRPGTPAATVDGAARTVLAERGFGAQFPHATGHGVGFAAIDHNAGPQLHPASREVLEEGMVFNVEPAVYIHGFGGLRHCDMVAVTRAGAEVLTPFQATAEQLIVAGAAAGAAPWRAGT